jgi:hypothetical protein
MIEIGRRHAIVQGGGSSVATLRIASSWMDCMMRRLIVVKASLVSISLMGAWLR